MAPVIESLWIYPVKACGGIKVPEAELTATGLNWDRRWMVITEHATAGRFVTQRTDPKLALRTAPLSADASLVLSAPSQPPLSVPLAAPPTALRACKVWEWTGYAHDEGDAAAAWFSTYLGKACRLVRYLGGGVLEGEAEPQRRQCDTEFARGQDVAFADGFPMLLANEASRVLVEQKVGEPIRMNRFRPNVVLTGCAAFEEDDWATLSAGHAPGGGEVTLKLVKPCSRCRVTTVEQETAERGEQPLQALKDFRSGASLGWERREFKMEGFFGVNATSVGTGRLSVGDVVTAVSKRQGGWA